MEGEADGFDQINEEKDEYAGLTIRGTYLNGETQQVGREPNY